MTFAPGSSHDRFLPSRTRLRRAIAAVGMLAGAGLIATACSSGPPTNFDTEFSVTAAIRQVPLIDDAGFFVLSAGDLAAFATAEGVDHDDAAAMAAAVATPHHAFVSLPAAAGPGWQQFDWNLTDADRFVSVTAVPVSFTVVAGDTLALPATLEPAGDSVFTDVVADDFSPTAGDKSLAIDEAGRPTRFAEAGSRVAFGSATPWMTAWLDGGKTLADDAGVAAVAGALDAHDVVSAVVTRPTKFSGRTIVGADATDAAAAAAEREYDPLVPPAPYDAVGVAWAIEDGADRWVIAYHFADADAASDGAQVLRAVWEKGKSLSQRTPFANTAVVSDVTITDSTVTVILAPSAQASPTLLWQLLQGREIVFASR